MPTVSALRAARPAVLRQVATELEPAVHALATLHRVIEGTHPAGLGRAWQAPAASAAAGRHTGLSRQAAGWHEVTRSGASALTRAALEIEDAQRLLAAATREADRCGGRLLEDGQAVCEEASDPAAAAALRTATSLARQALHRYAALAPTLSQAFSTRPEPDVPTGGQAPGRSRWPAADLDAVNRDRLRALSEAVARRLAMPEPNPAAREPLLALAADLQAVREVLDREPWRARQLLLLELSNGRLRAAVSSGPLDWAGHLAIFVPGFTTTVATHLAQYDARVTAVADLATRLSRQHGDGRPVVAITWHGYDAPQLSEVLRPGRSVATFGAAQDGAQELSDFVRMLLAQGGGRSLALWAHSYGSVVAGLALRDHRLPVDAAAMLGSPGLGVGALRQLNLQPGQLYIAEADADPVADLAWFGRDPGTLGYIRRLVTRARQLPDGELGSAVFGHEDYLSEGSTSAWNLAAIAAGVQQLALTERVCEPVRFGRPFGCGPS